mmetsp:Transcript_50820/g.110660  ORF Transcript_50820/g.110660 Transcript_50820/m.110660 type:complete len:354 (-) Transcript_50820:230-1291(-)
MYVCNIGGSGAHQLHEPQRAGPLGGLGPRVDDRSVVDLVGLGPGLERLAEPVLGRLGGPARVGGARAVEAAVGALRHVRDAVLQPVLRALALARGGGRADEGDVARHPLGRALLLQARKVGLDGRVAVGEALEEELVAADVHLRSGGQHPREELLRLRRGGPVGELVEHLVQGPRRAGEAAGVQGLHPGSRPRDVACVDAHLHQGVRDRGGRRSDDVVVNAQLVHGAEALHQLAKAPLGQAEEALMASLDDIRNQRRVYLRGEEEHVVRVLPRLPDRGRRGHLAGHLAGPDPAPPVSEDDRAHDEGADEAELANTTIVLNLCRLAEEVLVEDAEDQRGAAGGHEQPGHGDARA